MVEYEWDVEVVDRESGDIEDHLHQTSFADAMREARGVESDTMRADVVLVRTSEDGLNFCGRSWAYLGNDCQLPERFRDAHDRDGARVPKRFHEEVERWHRGR